MARASRSSSSSRSAPSQRRSASTAAAVPARPAPPAAPAAAPVAPVAAAPAQQQPGLFAQMATTAAGVAVGSSMGHVVSNMIFGGKSEPAPAVEAAPVQQQTASDPYRAKTSCDAQAKQFTDCLNATNSDMTSCNYYLEQLKQCQAFQATMN